MKSIADLLFAPARFFAAMEGKEHSLKIPALIAVTGALVSALAAYATMSGLYAGMFAASGAGAGMGMFMGLVGAVSAFIAFIVLWWVIMAGAFYVVSILFKGSGTFSSTLAVTGYGLVPTIIGTALSAISSLYYLPRITVPIVRNIQDPAVIQNAIRDLMQDPAMQEYSIVSLAFSVLFLVWSANIWIFGVKHARKLDTRNACITVLVPVGIMILYLLITFFASGLSMGGS
jgi:hypothetical protein